MKNLKQLLSEEEMNKLLCQLRMHDKSKLSLYYERGVCTLAEFNQARNKNYVYYFTK
jgi:hypothetical protein